MSLRVNPAVPDGAIDPGVRLTWTMRTRVARSPTSKTRAS
jgi:hypothetical protein